MTSVGQTSSKLHLAGLIALENSKIVTKCLRSYMVGLIGTPYTVRAWHYCLWAAFRIWQTNQIQDK